MPLKQHLLSWDQRRVLRERLGARAASLRAELGAALHSGGSEALGLPNHNEETDDDAVADLQSGLDVAAAERDARELAQVSEALARIDAAEFGKCARCGTPIAWSRLLAQPHARHCVRCAAGLERSAGGDSRPTL